MCDHYEAVKAIHWGIHSHVVTRHLTTAAFVTIFATAGSATADPITATVPDAPARRVIRVPAATASPSWDLDGFYVWLGPIGGASYVDAKWDSMFGGEAAVAVVRERASLALVAVDVGGNRWTARDGGRMWVDGLLGTRVLGRMMGASLGPLLEISQLARPRIGGSIGVWGFAGITPFARVGAITDLGIFAELGVHIALPVLRR